MPTPAQIKYVKDYYLYADRAARKYKHTATYMLAQAVAERGWSGSSLSKPPYNNFFGIISAGSPTPYWKGEKVTMGNYGLSFRVYPTMQDSFYDYALLLTKDMYRNVIKRGTPEQFATSISRSPYISEVNGDNRALYAANILAAIKVIDQVPKPIGTGAKILIAVSLMASIGYVLHTTEVIDLKKLTT